MNIAELFVRVRADVTDVDRRLKDVEARLSGVSRAAASTQLPMNKMNGALRALATQATHTSGPVGSLLTTLGSFAAGGAVMAGVLVGIAAIAKAYELMTAGAQKAKKETDGLIKSLVDQTKAAYNATVAGRDLIKLQAELELQAAKASSGIGWRTVVTAGMRGLITGKGGLAPADQAARDKRIADAETAVRQAGINLGKTWEEAQPKIAKVATSTQKAAKAAEEMAFSWKEALEAAYMLDNTVEKITLRDAATALGEAFKPDLTTDIQGSVDSVKEEIKTREELTHASQQNAEVIRNAVLQSANIIVSALNIGGGGKGSSLGGALGSTAGFALGFLGGGVVGGAIGSTIGNIAGSLLGGLFDSNKEAINRNTEATRANTAALLMNAPSGYKVAQGRFDATDIKEMREATRKYLTRGGAPVFAGA